MKDSNMAVYKLRECAQKAGEQIDNWVTRLRQLSLDCEFADVDQEIRAQILQKTNSKGLRRKILKHPTWKLKEVVEEARAHEASESQACDIEGATRSSEVNKISSYKERNYRRRTVGDQPKSQSQIKPNTHSTQKCQHCGRGWPHSGGMANCPARGKTCHKCGTVNHFASVCRNSRKHNPKNTKHGQGRWSSKQKPVNAIQHANSHASQDSSSDSDDYVFAVNTGEKLPHTSIKLMSRQLNFLVDTGSSVNIIGASAHTQLGSPKLAPTSIKLLSYGQDHPLKTLGKFKTKLEANGNAEQSDIIVAEVSSENILSYNTAQRLGLVNLNCPVYSVKPSTVMESDRLCAEYSGLFSDKVKSIKDANKQPIQVKIHRDPTVIPVAQPHRRVPFHMRKKVACETNRLEEHDIVEDVSGPTPWVSNIVVTEKRNGDPRICVDMRQANKAVIRERHPTDTVDDIATDMNGSKKFSIIDLREGYHQAELHPDSRDITTFSTHLGLRRYKRLIMGISSAPEIFNHIIRQTIDGIPRVRNIQDDIIVWGCGENAQAEHDESLRLLFQRLHERDVTLRRDKCQFNLDEAKFLGYIFSKDGLSADPDRVAEIAELDQPRNAGEIRSLLGMTNFCARFVPHYSDITEPLRRLMCHETDGKAWDWTPKHDAAFKKLKKALMNSPTTGYFDLEKETEIIVDASPVGVSAILTQYTNTPEDGYVVAYASHALSPVEQRYSQTDREALAVVWSCEHFHLYVYGKPVTVVTDHKPLENIFSNPRSRPTARLEKYALRLEPYQAKVVYRPGKDNPADYLSRHPTKNQDSQVSIDGDDRHVNFIVSHAVPKAMYLEEIKCATLEDTTLQEVAKRCRSRRWHDACPPNVDQTALTSFKRIQDELCVLPDNDLILRDHRIVIPERLQARTMAIAHEGHQGLVRTKKLLREKVWFPGIDRQAEIVLKDCLACQAMTASKQEADPPAMSDLPSAPWEKVSTDFWGPTPDGKYILLTLDEYSRFPLVDIVNTTAADTVIPCYEKWFGLFGIPQEVKSDNGPPFNGHVFAEFAAEQGFKHRKITPLWPQANGEAERFMKNLEKAVVTAVMEGKKWRRELFRYLRNYRATPHSSTDVAPGTVFFNRPMRIKLPGYINTPQDVALDQIIRSNDQKAKEKMKISKRRHEPGDLVLVKIKKRNKFTPKYDPKPYVITKRNGSMITAERADHRITRNQSFFKEITSKAASLAPQAQRKTHVEEILRQEPDPTSVEMANPPVVAQASDQGDITQPVPPGSTPEVTAEKSPRGKGLEIPVQPTTPARQRTVQTPDSPAARPSRQRQKPRWMADYVT